MQFEMARKVAELIIAGKAPEGLLVINEKNETRARFDAVMIQATNMSLNRIKLRVSLVYKKEVIFELSPVMVGSDDTLMIYPIKGKKRVRVQ